MSKEQQLMEESTSRWGNKTLLSVFFGVIVATNAFNRYVSNQERNTLQIQYEKERSDKKDERVLEQAKTEILIHNYKEEIARLYRELNECKKD